MKMTDAKIIIFSSYKSGKNASGGSEAPELYLEYVAD